MGHLLFAKTNDYGPYTVRDGPLTKPYESMTDNP